MLNIFQPSIIGAAALVLTVFIGGPIAAQQADRQQGEGQAPGQSQQTSTTVSGELMKVDSTARTLTVKTAAAEMEFEYNDQTKITGAQRDAAGLATATRSQVTVQYRKDGSDNIATSIEVRAAQSPQNPQAPPRQ